MSMPNGSGCGAPTFDVYTGLAATDTGSSAAGVDLMVTGSAVFDGQAPEANVHFMLEAVKAGAGKKKPEAREHGTSLVS